ncbi:hypothetical protein DW067_06325 [Lachnospira eligens]|uniref:hypothetical protein n=1 Tax=Lachnospira eligens TaxID=39485 RepID=UPI000E5D5362|nr:hypothetical protein [Lachnospira eligens]RHK45595.1 hypothetical protein DW067_06325 [Lachnospira eligens]RHK82640.1 hypothetical protein DW044_14540 [Lachnospira eligens]
MKHTKGRFSIRKHPFIITFIIMAVIAVVVAVGYIDVNHRFPEPEEEIVEKDEWVQYSDGIKIKVTGIDYCTEQEVNEKYSASVKELGRFNYIVLKVKVQNESQDKFNMFSIVTDSNLVIYRMDMKIREWYVKIMYLLIKARSKTLHWHMSLVKII